MTRTTYNKLVRDRIPEIIKKNNGVPQISILDDECYLSTLKEKLIEEAKEVAETKNNQELIGELADMLQVVESLTTQQRIDMLDIQKKKEEKKAARGGFDGRVFLEYVDEPDEI